MEQLKVIVAQLQIQMEEKDNYYKMFYSLRWMDGWKVCNNDYRVWMALWRALCSSGFMMALTITENQNLK